MERRHLPEMIEGQRVVLKKHALDFAELMFHYVDQDRERLAKFLPWVQFTNSVQDEMSYIQMGHQKWNRFELYDYSIFSKSDDTYMGNVGLHSIAWEHKRVEIGYWILGKYEGKGFMSDATEALMRAAFATGFNRIEIRCDAENLRSAGVPKKLRFQFDGRFEQDIVANGKMRDSLIFSMLRSRYDGVPSLAQPRQNWVLHALEFITKFFPRAAALLGRMPRAAKRNSVL